MFAFVQRANAEDKERDARARRLDASAVALLQSDPELGLLLATESARMSPGPAAEDALRQSLLASHARGIVRTRGPVGETAFSPDGRLLAFASESGWVRVRDLASGKDVFSRRVGKAGGVSFSEDGSSLLLHGSASPPVEVDAGSGKVTCVLEEGGRPAGDAAIVGTYAVVVRNARGYLWDRARCRLLQTVDEVGKTAVRVVPSADGFRVAFVSGSMARVVEVPSGRQLLELPHPSAITSLAFDGDGETIVTGSRDGIGRVWSGNTGRLRRLLRGHRGRVLDVAIDSEGVVAATVSTDGTGRTWDVPAGTVAAVLFGHTNFVDAVDFGPDAESVVTASLDGSARTWAVTGMPLALLNGHTGAVLDARFSPDGTLVATGGEDGTVRVWDAETRGDLERADAEPPSPVEQETTSATGDATARIDGKVVQLERADGTDERARPAHAPRHQRRVFTGRPAPRDREQRSRRDSLGRRVRQGAEGAAGPLQRGLGRALQPRRPLDRDCRSTLGRSLEGVDGRARPAAPRADRALHGGRVQPRLPDGRSRRRRATS